MSEERAAYTDSTRKWLSADPAQIRLSERLKNQLGWAEWIIDVAVRAEFRCEYCDKNLIASVDSYREWQHDHIIPKRVRSENQDDIDNLALSCRLCNVNFKGKWDPSHDLSDGASREELIQAARKYVANKRTRTMKEVVRVRDAVFGD